MNRILTETLNCTLMIVSWKESPHGELDGHGRLTREQIALTASEGGVESAWIDSIKYHRSDGTADCVALMRLSGNFAGRRGSVVLKGHGTYDRTVSRQTCSVLPGSGVGELVGIAGTAVSASADDDFPFVSFVFRFTIGTPWPTRTTGHWIARDIWTPGSQGN